MKLFEADEARRRAVHDMGAVREELNVGQLCRERFGDKAALIGFGTHAGMMAAHPVEARLCRKLLEIFDRCGSRIAIRQADMATMLAVRRTTVTLVERSLAALGAIEVRRGHLALLDRKRLEERTCGCYRRLVELVRTIDIPANFDLRKPSESSLQLQTEILRSNRPSISASA